MNKQSLHNLIMSLKSVESKRKIFALIFLTFVGFGVYQSFLPSNLYQNILANVKSSNDKDDYIIKKDDLSIFPVKVLKLQSKKITPVIKALGVIEYLDKVAITSKTDGRIKKIYAKVGDRVRKGQLLVQLEKLPLRMQLDKVKAAVKVAQADYNLTKREYRNAKRDIEIKFRDIERKDAIAKELKAKLEKSRVTFRGKLTLYQTGGISKEEMELEKINLKTAEARFRIGKLDYLDSKVGFRDKDIQKEGLKVPTEKGKRFGALVEINTLIHKERVAASKSRLDAAEVDLKNVEILLKETNIRSPINGYVATRNKGMGEEVKGGSVASLEQAIMVLVDINKVYTKLNLKESELKRIRVGMRVDFAVDFYPNKKYTSYLVSINPIVNETTHTVEVRSILHNYDKTLKPGMFIRGKIVMGSPEKMILVPSKSLIPRDKNNAYVFMVVEGRAIKTEVTTGKEFDDRVAILSGLKEGDIVVIDKLSQMQDNLSIKPVMAKED